MAQVPVDFERLVALLRSRGFLINSALITDVTPVTLDASADTLLGLTGQELSLDTQVANLVFAGPSTGVDAVPTFRALVAADLPSTVVLNTIQVIAGAGLTGGGALSANVTLNVAAADTSITVNADSIQVRLATTSGLQISTGLMIADTIAGAGLTITGKVLAVGAGNGITVGADSVALTTPGTLTVATTNNSSGNHTHAVTSSSNPGAVASLLASDANGYLQLVRLGAGVSPSYPLHAVSAANSEAFYVVANSLTTGVAFTVEAPLSTGVNDGKAFQVKVNGESFGRVMFYTDGKFGVGGGAATRDTFLSRSAANTWLVSSDGGSGAANIAVNDNAWVGLGSAAGRIAFDNQATDFISFMNAWVGVGIAGPADLFHVYGGGLKVEGDGDATHSDTGGTIILQNTSLSGLGVNDDVAGMVRAMGLNAVGDPVQVADIYFQITDVTAGAQSSALRFLTQLGGADVFLMNLVEDKVGINELVPTEALDVTGNIIATGNITATGDLVASGGDVFSGVNDTTRGILHAYGPGTGQTLGGLVRLYMAADHDTTNNFWQVDVNSTTLRFVVDGATSVAELTTAGSFQVDGSLTASGGNLIAGVPDSIRGVVYVYGPGAGQTQGGVLRLHMAADHDTSFDYWQMDVEQDTIRFLTVGTARAYISPTGNIIATGNLYAGVNDTTAGIVLVYGAGSGTEGGEVQLHFAAPHDTTYEYYRIDAFEDDLRFGREGETAVTFAGATGDVAVFGNATGQVNVAVSGAAGTIRQYCLRTGAANRWVIRADATAESGSNAGSDFAILSVSDAGAGANVFRILRANGAVLFGNATGGYIGPIGTINAPGVYDDGSLLTPYVLEAHLNGRIDMEALDAKVPNRTIPPKIRTIPAVTRTIPARRERIPAGIDERTGLSMPERFVDIPAREEIVEPEREEIVEPEHIEERTHGPARRFAANMVEELDPVRYAAKWKRDGHLPALPSEAEWAEKGNFTLGDLVQRLMETVEVQAVHISKLTDRLTAVEASLNN